MYPSSCSFKIWMIDISLMFRLSYWFLKSVDSYDFVLFLFMLFQNFGLFKMALMSWFISLNITSVQLSHSVVSDSLRPHESQYARPPCPSPTPGVHSDSRPSILWCHPAISSSVIPFSSCPQSLPAWGSFPMSQPFTWGGQSIGVSASASVLPMNTQDWSPLR